MVCLVLMDNMAAMCSAEIRESDEIRDLTSRNLAIEHLDCAEYPVSVVWGQKRAVGSCLSSAGIRPPALLAWRHVVGSTYHDAQCLLFVPIIR
jgi:hypothetical protein